MLLNHLVALFNERQYEQVVTEATKNLATNDVCLMSLKLLGCAYKQLGNAHLAIKALRRANALAIDDYEIFNALGAAYFDVGQYDDAEMCYQNALHLAPKLSEVHNNLGVLFRKKMQYQDAEFHFKQALSMNRTSAIAHYNLAGCLREQGEHREALKLYREAADADPEDARFRLAVVVQSLSISPQTLKDAASTVADFDCALDGLCDWVSASPGRRDALIKAAGTQQPYFLAYRLGNHKERLAKYGDLLAEKGKLSRGSQQKRPKIRLAIVSQYFYRHSVWDVLIRGLLLNLDRQQFELALYYTGSQEDQETDFARYLADIWHQSQTIEALGGWAMALSTDSPDVIFYPEIAMDPITCRLAVQRLAPLQIASWGHPITTGLPTIDLYFSGELIEGPEAAGHYRERLIRLPGTGCCTSPIDLVAESPSEIEKELDRRGGIRFLAPHRAFKFEPAHDEIFSRIASEVGQCTFVFMQDIKYPWATQKFVARLSALFRGKGLNPDRYVLVIPWLPRAQFVALLDICDIYLDCPSFSGYTTAWQAVQRGLPVVTLEGEFMRQRLAAGLMRQIDVTDTIAGNIDQYVEIAVTLAAERNDDVRWLACRDLLKQASALADHNIAVVRKFEAVVIEEHRRRSGESVDTLQSVQAYAQAGRFPEMMAACQRIFSSPTTDVAQLLDIGALLSTYGFLGQARACYERAHALALTDLGAMANLANLARDAGDHTESRRLYADLLRQHHDHPIIRRNALTSLEYDPEVPDVERLAQAKAWGEWAIARAGGYRPRPAMLQLGNRPLRIGYVSADLCQHTVGLFVKDVLKAHDPARVQVFVYSAGQVKDWVTDEIRAACTLRDVAAMDDAALAEQIRADEIDVLIDLSGHTAGSRLTAFAHRPAPVMVSWLGYFATTGLPYIDAVLLDEWHAPSGSEAQFVEPIIRLPSRFCYTPVPWMPAVSPAPTFSNGHITFGCFNNTAKFNDGVFDVWAKILQTVPYSRLILKWRTFNDDAFRQKVTQAFVERGIAVDRIELRGPSFHADLLKEYADIDIALDPFPFTGGQSSCEALWMGVPVVTWPQSRVVSRQTFAFLSAIGLPELAAKDADDYVRIAAELASDPERLAHLRTTLRDKMRASPLMDVDGFTRQLEDTLIDLYRKIEAEESTKAMNAKTILHVGPGHRNNGAKLPPAFQGSDWKEIRLDIDPVNEPDILGSMLDMASVADASVDAIYSAHNIEHVYAYEVPVVLKEFLRVLKPEGFLVVTCPDLQAVCQMVAEDKLGDAAYTSQAGSITPLDILYGHGEALAGGHHYMAHKTGFTLKTLTQALHAAGFATSGGKRRARGLDLWVVATKSQIDEAALRELAGKVLPG